MPIVQHLYADLFGSHIGKYQERLKITQGGETRSQAPLMHLQGVTIASLGVSISADAIAACCERGIPMRIHCPDLGLRGELDELVIAPGGVYLPVDYKLSTKVSDSFRVQIAAYALLVESRFRAEGARVETGYLYLIVPRSLHPVPITEELRTQVRASLTAIRDILLREHLPPLPRARAKCRDCEFRRFCNDV